MKFFSRDYCTRHFHRKAVSIILFLTLLAGTFTTKGQSTTSGLIGQNYWMTNYHYSGVLRNALPQVDAMDLQLIRIGGHGYNDAYLGKTAYDLLLNDVASAGATPSLQISDLWTAAQRTELLSYLKSTGRNIIYFSIGNEPDNKNANYDVAKFNQAFIDIAKVIRQYYPNAIIAGGSFSDVYSGPYERNVVPFVAAVKDQKDANGKYLLNVLDYHNYTAAFKGGVALWDAQKLKDQYNTLILPLLNSMNATRPATEKVSWSMSEFNIAFNNEVMNIDVTTYPPATHKSWSFFTGQYMAMVFGMGMQYGAMGMMPWSLHESSGSRAALDLGFFDGAGPFTPRPSYYHTQMFAQNKKANFTTSTSNKTDVQTVAMSDATGVTVFVMNTKTNAYALSLSLNNTASATGLAVNVNAGIAKTITENIGGETTLAFVFDASGNLTKKISYSKANADAKVAPTTTPYNVVVTPKTIPGVVQAEDYTTYYNVESTQMRVATTDAGGGTKMGYNSVGDWYNYSVNVATAGTYTVTFRVANGLTTNGQFQLKNGTTVLTTVDVAPTGGWDTFVTLSKTVTLTAGAQTLTLATVVAGVDYNWMEFAQATPVLTTIAFTTSLATTTAGTNATFVAKGYDQFGQVMTSTITYSVSAGATISAAGVFASTTPGSYTVTAKSGTVTKTATITVSAGAVNTITVTATLASITSGLTQQYSAVAKDAYNNTVTTNFTWAVSGGGTISATGLFTATTVGGSFNVTATSGTKTGTKTVTVTAAAATGIAIPGTVQAEDYTAYNNAQNTQMRVATTDAGGGTKMGYNDAGDWYEYSVNVATAGSYTVTFRVANGSAATGQFQLKKGATVLTTVDVAPTGGWDTFVTLTKTVSFTATGTQTISLAVVTAGVDINWFNAVVATNPVVNSVAFNPTMTVESGDTYTVAVTYSSTTANDVNVGFYTAAWGWVAGQTQTVAAGSGVLNFTITIPAGTAVGTTYIWQTQIMPVGGTYLQRYAVVNKTNVQVTNFKSATVGLPDSMNDDKLMIYPSPVSETLYLEGVDGFTKIDLFNSAGQLVNTFSIKDTNNSSIDMSVYRSGIYFVKLVNSVETKTKRIIKN